MVESRVAAPEAAAPVRPRRTPSHPAASPAAPSPREELDALLDKISAQGFGALSEAERRRLDELSQRLR